MRKCPKRGLSTFQFFPSCSLEEGEGQAGGRGAALRAGDSNWLSILSQLQLGEIRVVVKGGKSFVFTFNSFPVAAGQDAGLPDAEARGAKAAAPFNSFPVAAGPGSGAGAEQG